MYKPASVGSQYDQSTTVILAPRLRDETSQISVQRRRVSILPSIYRFAVITESLYISVSESGVSRADVCDTWSSCAPPFWESCP